MGCFADVGAGRAMTRLEPSRSTEGPARTLGLSRLSPELLSWIILNRLGRMSSAPLLKDPEAYGSPEGAFTVFNPNPTSIGRSDGSAKALAVIMVCASEFTVSLRSVETWARPADVKKANRIPLPTKQSSCFIASLLCAVCSGCARAMSGGYLGGSPCFWFCLRNSVNSLKSVAVDA